MVYAAISPRPERINDWDFTTSISSGLPTWARPLCLTSIAPTGLSHPLQARLLGVLRGRRPTMAELGKLLDLDKSSTTGLIDRGQRRGLVARVTDPVDGRCYRVELTEDGRRAATQFVACVTSDLTAPTSFLDEDRRSQLASFISDVVTTNANANELDLSAELSGNGAAAPTPD